MGSVHKRRKTLKMIHHTYSSVFNIRPFVCSEQLTELFSCRVRRKFQRGLKRKPLALIKRLRKAKKDAPPLEKPEVPFTLQIKFIHQWFLGLNLIRYLAPFLMEKVYIFMPPSKKSGYIVLLRSVGRSVHQMVPG